SLLVRRVRNRLAANELQCVGTSATIAGAGSFEAQRKEVADVAAQVFGADFKPENIVGETLQRATPPMDFSNPQSVSKLTELLSNATQPPTDYDGYCNSPLSVWIEDAFGLTMEGGRLVRSKPKQIGGEGGAAQSLSQLTGIAVERCI